MAKINKKPTRNDLTHLTHEGAPAKRINTELELRRSVMACLLWENTFYEEGEEIADRIKALIKEVVPEKVADIAIEAREKMKLRHVPLLIVREMARLPYHSLLVAKTLERIIQRPDELTEFLSIYWKDGRQKLSAQVKKGLAKAFPKFNAYGLAKYNRDEAVKLRDVLFLCHAKPKDSEQEATWKKLIDGTLESPDTWEVSLSAGKDKKETWERLLKENKLGGLALLRNLRNMLSVKVDESLICSSIQAIKTERILPYRFIASARYAPQFEPQLEQAMFKCLEGHEKLTGKTILLVDVSGSMDAPISNKSEMTRIDAACGLSILARELCEEVEIFSFSESLCSIPPRRGFALRDAIKNSQEHCSTYLGAAINSINQNRKFDRIIVFTDEQSHDAVSNPKERGYMINVASYKHGVGYGKWVHIDGFSEAILDYIKEFETLKGE